MRVAPQEGLLGRLDQAVDMVEPSPSLIPARSASARISSDATPAWGRGVVERAGPGLHAQRRGPRGAVGGKVGGADRAAQRGQIGRDIGRQRPVIEIGKARLTQARQGAASAGWRSTSPSHKGRPSGSNTWHRRRLRAQFRPLAAASGMPGRHRHACFGMGNGRGQQARKRQDEGSVASTACQAESVPATVLAASGPRQGTTEWPL
jgi:hypothetical protein